MSVNGIFSFLKINPNKVYRVSNLSLKMKRKITFGNAPTQRKAPFNFLPSISDLTLSKLPVKKHLQLNNI